jgi:hypothetical protein
MCRTSAVSSNGAWSKCTPASKLSKKVHPPEVIPTVAGVPLWIIARDSQYVANAETDAIVPTAHPNRKAVWMSFKLTSVLKGVSLIGIQESWDWIKTEGAHESCPVLKSEAARYPPGSQVFILFNRTTRQKVMTNAGRATCLVVPITKENVTAIDKGISYPDSHYR